MKINEMLCTVFVLHGDDSGATDLLGIAFKLLKIISLLWCREGGLKPHEVAFDGF
jgi:hypothetical protein